MSQVALIVDITHYQVLPALPIVSGDLSDVKEISKLLSTYGNFQVRYLPRKVQSQGSSLKVVQKELEDLIRALLYPKTAHIPSMALLYFTGHCLQRHQSRSEIFLATSDANPAQGRWGISLSWLQHLLQLSPIQNLIVWLDCCYSEPLNFTFSELTPKLGKSYSLIVTNRCFQMMPQGISLNPSALKVALLQGLNPSSSGMGRVTTLTLTHFMATYLAEYRQPLFYLNLGEPILLTYHAASQHDRESSSPRTRSSCPFPGLRPFQVEESSYFFGRRDLTARLLNKVRLSRFVALVGNSGTGKSSLLKAGLIHSLQTGSSISGSDRWIVRFVQPGEKPLNSLVLALLNPDLSTAERSRQLNQIQPLVHQGANGFRKILEVFFRDRLVLIVDQFEEMFTLCQNALERETFLDCLLGAIAPGTSVSKVSPHHHWQSESQELSRFCCVLSLRADYLGQCLEMQGGCFSNYLQENLIMIPPMDRQTLREVIVEPAQQANFSLNPDLVNTILQDADYGSNTLPLLQYILFQLWRQGKDLQVGAYRELGGIRNSLNQRANLAYEGLTDLEQETAHHIFLALVQMNESGVPLIRGVVNRDLVTPRYTVALINVVVQKLVHEQLLTTEAIPLATGIEQPFLIRLAHEIIAQEWKLLQKWLSNRQDNLRKKQKIEEAAKVWQNVPIKAQKNYLLTGTVLKEARKFQEVQPQLAPSDRVPLSQVAEVFIQASIRTQQREQAKLIALIGIIPLILLVFGGFKLYQQSQFQRYWQIVKDNQGKRESMPRLQALETLNQMGQSLSNQDFNEINLQGINLANANLVKSSFTESFLTGANLSQANLEKADLTQTELTGANLTGANLSQGKLLKSYLTGANFSKVNLGEADLSGANLMRINLTGANLQKAKFAQAELTGANLANADLSNSDLTRANLWGADFSDANLNNTNFSHADLTRVNLAGAKLKGVNLEGANLTNADFSSVNDIPLAQVKSACNWQKATFTEETKRQLAQTKAAKFPACH